MLLVRKNVLCYLCEIQIPVKVLRTRDESIISDRWYEDIPERTDKVDVGGEVNGIITGRNSAYRLYGIACEGD